MKQKILSSSEEEIIEEIVNRKTFADVMKDYKKPKGGETPAERKKRLARRRQAKRRFLAKLNRQTEQSSSAGPSNSTRSQIRQNLPISTRTREANKLR